MYYPIFEQCLEWTMDPDIENELKKYARGEFPSNVKFEKNTLICDKKSYKLTGDSFENYQIFLKIFKQKATKKTQKANYNEDWSSIRSKKIKQRLIMQFISKNMEDHSICLKDARLLLSILNLALLLKIIKNDDISYQNGAITAVCGLNFDEGKYDFDFNSFDCKYTESSTADKIMQSLERYIKDLKATTIN